MNWACLQGCYSVEQCVKMSWRSGSCGFPHVFIGWCSFLNWSTLTNRAKYVHPHQRVGLVSRDSVMYLKSVTSLLLLEHSKRPETCLYGYCGNSHLLAEQVFFASRLPHWVFKEVAQLSLPLHKASRADNCVQISALLLGQYWIMQALHISTHKMEISSATALPSQPLFRLDEQKSQRCNQAHTHTHKCTHTLQRAKSRKKKKKKKMLCKTRENRIRSLTETTGSLSFAWVILSAFKDFKGFGSNLTRYLPSFMIQLKGFFRSDEGLNHDWAAPGGFIEKYKKDVYIKLLSASR